MELAQSTRKAIVRTLQTLNWKYGKGDLQTVDFAKMRVTVKCPFTGTYTYQFRYESGTVFYKRHKSKI